MTEKLVIDATGTVLGRLGTYVAKQALEGKEVDVVNCENAIISGSKKDVIKRYSILKAKGGHSQKGPRISRVPYMILKRTIRGMLPDHRKGVGRQAFKRIKCHDGVPKELADKEKMTLKTRLPAKYIKLKELSSRL